MTDDEVDRLKNGLPMTASPVPRLDDGVLLAYSEHRLGPAQTQQVEHLLAHDPEARALLGELAKPVSAEDIDALARLTVRVDDTRRVVHQARRRRSRRRRAE